MSKISRNKKSTRISAFIHIFALITVVIFLIDLLLNRISANPVQDIILRTGRSALIFLFTSLACSPLVKLLRLTALIPARKWFGLYSFYYAALHLVAYVGLDFQFQLQWLLPEIKQKPFIIIGLSAFLLLIPLAITSNKKIQARIGKVLKYIHKVVYLIGFLILVHYFLVVKGEKSLPLFLLFFYSILILFRLPPLNRIEIGSPPHWLEKINHWLIQ